MSNHAWDQRDDETGKAYAAFLKYLEQPRNSRTLAGAARATYGDRGVLPTGLAVGRIRAWASDNEWEARARAYDQHLDDIKRQAAEDEAREMGLRHAREAQLIEQVLLAPAKALAQRVARDPEARILFDKMTDAELARLVDRAGRGHALVARFERLSRGMSDGRVEVTGKDGGPIEMSIEDARETLAPILGVDPEQVVDELAARRRAARERRKAGEADKETGT